MRQSIWFGDSFVFGEFMGVLLRSGALHPMTPVFVRLNVFDNISSSTEPLPFRILSSHKTADSRLDSDGGSQVFAGYHKRISRI